MNIDPYRVPSPCFVLDADALERNLAILADVQQRAGCKILLALKGFAMWRAFPLIRRHLSGTAASGVHEARLGAEAFGGEVHVYSPAYRDVEVDELTGIVDHMVFNSFSQWERHRERVQRAKRPIQCGMRVNPEHSEVKVALYDPCAPGSRLGVTEAAFRRDLLDGLSGLHMHTLCELNADALERTLPAFEKHFGGFLPSMSWVNLGGGHHVTRPDYDIERLIRIIQDFRERWHVDVYLEPGEAIALNAGVFVATVLDIVHNHMDIAILDASASTHMPDVLEMPYRPAIVGAGMPGELAHTYRLGGVSCLAGDVIGDYSFAEPLRPGRRLVFLDMAHYTMVKTTTFNGVPLPAIAIGRGEEGAIEIVRQFGYDDYKTRLS